MNTEDILIQAKQSVRLIVTDYDGTLIEDRNPLFSHQKAIEVIQSILVTGKNIAVLTARGVTALKALEQPLTTFLKTSHPSGKLYIGLGNGTLLFELTAAEKRICYNHGLSISEIDSILKLLKQTYDSLHITKDMLNTNGVYTSETFTNQNWTGYIPKEIIALFQPYDGMFFCEEIKVTAILPRDESLHNDIVQTIQEKLGTLQYQAKRGDTTYLHITHTFDRDPKLFALQTVMKKLDIKEQEVVVFGDMPRDNDKGMLIEGELPFTFTNSKEETISPPYKLLNSTHSVQQVYDAIAYLIA